MRRTLCLFALVAIMAGLLPTAAFAADDWDVPGGHYFTQTGGGGGKGYLVTDQDDIRFWSEFQRLGGVQAVGYPASQRFQWDGFTVQVFQRVVFQWRPESKSVAFVNVFDRLDQLGKNDWLRNTRQTPAPKTWSEAGMPWEQIVTTRLAVMDAYPAIKAKYQAVVGDPIQSNGLPTSDVVDMGNHFALRAQRVVFQQWKEDVPWAKRGEVTVALGGDIAKEAGVLPNANALVALASPESPQASVPTPNAIWAYHDDAEKRFKYPATWRGSTNGSLSAYIHPNGVAAIFYASPLRMGSNFKLEDLITSVLKATASGRELEWGERRTETINGATADLQWFQYKGQIQTTGIIATYQRGNYVHFLILEVPSILWPTFEPFYLEVVRSYEARTQ